MKIPTISTFESLAEAMKEATVTSGHPIDPIAQAMELRSRYASLYGPVERDTIGVGAIVRAKRGLSRYTHHPIMIIWRLLSIEDKQDYLVVSNYISQYSPGEKLDCIVGYLHDTGECVLFEPHAMSLLEVCNDL